MGNTCCSGDEKVVMRRERVGSKGFRFPAASEGGSPTTVRTASDSLGKQRLLDNSASAGRETLDHSSIPSSSESSLDFAEWAPLSCARSGARSPTCASPTNISITFEELNAADQICPICLLEITPFEETSSLPCKHKFHKECIEEWIEFKGPKAASCPTCRRDLGDQ